jgi:hypothetical protein
MIVIVDLSFDFPAYLIHTLLRNNPERTVSLDFASMLSTFELVRIRIFTVTVFA